MPHSSFMKDFLGGFYLCSSFLGFRIIFLDIFQPKPFILQIKQYVNLIKIINPTTCSLDGFLEVPEAPPVQYSDVYRCLSVSLLSFGICRLCTHSPHLKIGRTVPQVWKQVVNLSCYLASIQNKGLVTSLNRRILKAPPANPRVYIYPPASKASRGVY